MLEQPENPPQPPSNIELQEILSHLQHMHADQVVAELKSVQDDANNIKGQIDGEEEHLKMHSEKLPKSVQNSEATMTKLNNITNVVKRVIVAIATGRVEGDIFDGVPDRSKSILQALCTQSTAISEISKVNHNNSLFINEIIIRGIEGRLETTEQLISAFESINMLKYPHNHLYTEIADLFRAEAKKNRATEEDLEKLMTEEQKKTGRPEMVSKEKIKENRKLIEELQEDSQGLRNTMRTMIGALDTTALEKSRVGMELIAKTTDPDERKRLLEQEVHKIQTQLIFKLENMGAAAGSRLNARAGTVQQRVEAMIRANSLDGQITGGDLAGNFEGFERLINELNREGILNASTYEDLLGLATNLNKNNELFLEYHEKFVNENKGKVGRLAYMALSYITTWSPKDEALLQVLDNKEAFIKYGREHYDSFKEPKDWQDFNRDIRHIFHTMFAGTSSNAKDFWQSTFSELKEGMVYKELTTALFNLGDQLKEDTEYGDKNMPNLVKIKDVYAKAESASYEKSILAGAATITTDKTVNISLGRAVRAFTFEMLDYKELTQYTHDIIALTEAGLGFEKLAEFSARLRQEDISRLIRNMPGLADAISLYQSNLGHKTARDARTISADFGRRLIIGDNLDNIGRETFLQLKHLNKIKKLMKDGELAEADVIRMVTFATGISKGVIGSFWEVVGNNLADVEITEVARDPDHPDDPRRFSKAAASGKSSSDKGQEMMWASLDLIQTWTKYHKPRLWQEIKCAYAPRDIKNYDPNRVDYWSKHDDIFKWNTESERAFANGASNEYIDFTEDHCFLKESMKTLITDVALRGGWRLYDYRKQLVYKEEGQINPVTGERPVDFHKTIMRLRGIGDSAVKTFIKDLFSGSSDYQIDPSKLSIEDIGFDMIEENRKTLEKFGSIGKELNHDQKKALEIIFYEKYVFEQVRHTQPSLFIAMETREVMPEDEVRGTRRKDGGFDKGFTFQEQLLDYLTEVYKDKCPKKDGRAWIKTNLLPMYISALQVTEKNEWNKKYDIWKQNEKNGITDLNKNPFDIDIKANRFSVADFDKEDNHDSLIEFYVDSRTSIGKTVDGLDEYWLEDEGFIKNLKGFYRKMEEVIDRKDRWDHNTVKNKFGDWVHTGEKETLMHRYAKLLKADRAGVDSYTSWALFNLDEFNFETSGNRQTQRVFAEAALWAQEGNKLIDAIFSDQIGAFTMKEVRDDHEFEKSVEEHFVEAFKKLHKVVANVEDDTSYIYQGKMIMFLVSAMADDRINRIGVVGPILKGGQRRLDKTPSSYMTSKIQISNREGATSLDTSSRVEILINTIGNKGVQMAREKEQVIGKGPARFFGLLPGKNIYAPHGEEHMSIEQLVNVAQVGLGTRLKENILMPGPILLIILAMLAKLALDKDNKK